jgi:hypothetical protein
MSDTPIQSPEAREAQEELAAEKAWRTQNNANALAAQVAEIRHLNAKANVRNAAAWFITMAWIVGAVVVVTQVIL